MRRSIIYIHYEPFAHLFVTAGISADDLIASEETFSRLLVLPPIDDNLPLDPTTGFNLVSGDEEVRTFMRSREARKNSWLDCGEGAYLQEMTPREVAELLYLAHAKTHLQPPFYSKLQNQLAYVPSGDDLTRLYIRRLSLFERTLAQAILRRLRLAANEQPFWLRLRGLDFLSPNQAVLRALMPYFEDGALLDFSAASFFREAAEVPLFHAKNHLQALDDAPMDAADKLGELHYDSEQQSWELLA